MISHILFPSDLSKPSLKAFETVLDLALTYKAKVTLFHAYELLSNSNASRYDLSLTSTLRELELTMEEKASLHLGDFKRQLDQSGIASSMVIRRGAAGECIVELAAAKGCDLIVIGSRGLGPVRSFLLGSTSTYVLHHSRCPMMVIPVESD